MGADLVTNEDTPVSHTIDASDPDGRALTFQVQQPGHGSVTLTGMELAYTPNANFNGADAFAVQVSNGEMHVSGSFTVTVTAVNDAPVAVADAFSTPIDTALVEPFSALLTNDTDVDGDTLTIMSVQNATHGTVSMNATDVTFTPTTAFTGAASFEYTITDGTLTSNVTVMVTVAP